MEALLLIGYGGLAAWAIWKMPFLRKSGIRPCWLFLLFALHVATGWLHNRVAFRYFPEHGDIWNYFSLSFLYRSRLFHHFDLFLSDNSTWTYITHNGIVFIQMILDEFSGGDMTINTLLFSFPVFLGNVALFRVFRRRFPDNLAAATTVFWIPSVLFWTACIYREGMLYMLLGFLLLHLDNLSAGRAKARHSILCALVLFLLIAYFRLAVAVILLPALLVWWLFSQPPRIRIIAAAAVLLLAVTLHNPAIRALSTEQSSFQILEGHSRLPLPILDGTLTSVLHALPAAIKNGFFQPLPGSGGQPIYLAFSIELLLIWILAFLAILATIRNRTPSAAAPPSPPPHSITPFPTVCLLLALAGMLVIGLVVPFAGTIVRYRSIYLPFLLAPTLHALRHHPILRTLNNWLSNRLNFLI